MHVLLNNKRMVILIVSLALFMDALDTTIINTAIPAISRSFNTDPVDLKMALLSYLLSLAIFIPISGWLADKYGMKKVFMFALFIFTLSSLACGYAQNLTELVIARSIQGIGGSLMLPIGRLILVRTFERHELVDAMSHVIMVVSTGLMLGPFAGGFITDHLSWPWIFWINVPVGLLAFIVTGISFKDFAPRRVRPFDFVGFLLFGSGLATLIYSLAELSASSVNVSQAITLLVLSQLLLIFYYIHSRKQQHPIVKTKLFQLRTFQISMFGNLFGRLGFGGIPFLLPLLLQVGLGYSAQMSGLLVLPIAVGILFVKSITGHVLRWFGFKKLLLINTILVAILLSVFQIINYQTSVVIIILLTFLFGFFIAIQYSGMNTLAFADIEHEDLSAATSIIGTIQQLSVSFGVATSALLLRLFASIDNHSFTLTPQVFHQTFFALSLLTLLSNIIFIRLHNEDGRQMLLRPNKDKMVVDH